MSVSWETACVLCASLGVASGCARSAKPAPELTQPAPTGPELPPVDVDALLAREGLLSEPYEDTCCGEGRVTLERTLWAELDGQDPPELVLELMEYIGEGGASWHYHVFDVRDATRPEHIGPVLVDGGYMHYSYMEVTDLDADGVDELMMVSEIRDAAPLHIYVMREGALVSATTASEQAQVYIRFDHDGDGREELIGLKSPSLDGEEPVEVMVLRAPSGEAHPNPRAVSEWLPRAATATLTRASIPHAEPTLTLLARAMSERGLSPSDPGAALDAMLTRLEAEELDVHIDTYAQTVSGASTQPQRERLVSLMKVDHSDRASLAARVWLRTSPSDERARALEWAANTLDAWARSPDEDVHLRIRGVVRELDAAERARMCAQTGRLLRDPDVSRERVRGMVWDLWTPLQCAGEVVDALEDQKRLTHDVLRGAIHAYSWGKDASPEVAARYAALEPEVAAALEGLLSDSNATIRAEAARAMGGLQGTTQTLRDALDSELDGEVKRSLLIALSESSDPGNPELFLRLLGEPQTDEVVRRLHAELARSGDLDVLERGLASARTPNAYGAYEWRLVYRGEEMTEPERELIARDAFTRLADPQPRVRQSACAILTERPHLRGDVDALTRAARQDDTPWVRSACAEALEVMWSGIGPM